MFRLVGDEQTPDTFYEDTEDLLKRLRCNRTLAEYLIVKDTKKLKLEEGYFKYPIYTEVATEEGYDENQGSLQQCRYFKIEKLNRLEEEIRYPETAKYIVNELILKSGGSNPDFNFNNVVTCYAIRSQTKLEWFLEETRNKMGRFMPKFNRHAQYDERNTLLRRMMQWFDDNYPSKYPLDIQPQKFGQFKNILVFHGMRGTFQKVELITETKFVNMRERNDGWYGSGIYFHTGALLYKKWCLAHVCLSNNLQTLMLQ
eukprot:m.133725 g.133725  ORF g.133725 m.133725 type:complete len:257 (-) comp14679_c0_seq3:501-1271(-)